MKFIIDYFPSAIVNYIILSVTLIAVLFIMYKFIMSFGAGVYKIAVNINDSFKIKEGGYSARKLSAAVAVWVSVYMSIRFTDDKVMIQVVAMWLIFALLLLGVVAWSDVMKIKILGGGGGGSTEEIIKKTASSQETIISKVEEIK